MSLEHQDMQTEASLFRYVEEPHSATAHFVEFFYPTPDAEHAEMGFQHGAIAVVVWDPAAAELIRCGPELMKAIHDVLHEQVYIQGADATKFRGLRFEHLEPLGELYLRLTRGATEGGAR